MFTRVRSNISKHQLEQTFTRVLWLGMSHGGTNMQENTRALDLADAKRSTPRQF